MQKHLKLDRIVGGTVWLKEVIELVAYYALICNVKL